MQKQILTKRTEDSPRQSVRLYYLDWVRVIAILLVLVYHSSRFFNMEEWHVKNPTWYPWVEVWNSFAITWMMPLIFVISGASLFFAVGKGGTGKFIKDKALRLLVPWFVGVFTHAMLQVYLERVSHGDFSGTFFQFIPHYFSGMYEGDDPSAGNFALGGIHLWYLLYLFVFSVVLYPLLRWLKGSGKSILFAFDNLLAKPGMVYALVIPTLLLLVLIDPDNPVMAEREAGWSLVIYVWLLFSGFVVVSSEPLQASFQRLRWLSLILALVSVVTYLLFVFSSAGYSLGPSAYPFLSGLRGLSSWCWILATLGFGRQYLNFSTPTLKYANEAVLPFYILHQTVLICVGYFVVNWQIPDLVKWLLILTSSFIIIMALYEYLIRRFNLLRFLFGMKPLPKTATMPADGALVTR